ncbi:BTAD domain-containing putative transcriptional regulator [Gemmatimonas sp.]|uniref:BTAD domain-containing putative transcriptional regulator n=1 Tax=Gemmatimonas sp. TaxID=1962908 RepID=UPI0039832408
MGGLRLVQNGQPVAGKAAHRRRLALLVLLSSTPKRRLTRERLIDFLWEEAVPEAGRRLLSESLYQLRSELGDNAIRSVGDEVELDPALVPSDLDHILDADARRDDAALLRIPVGAFLDGWYLENAPGFSMWADTQRERVRATLLRLYMDAAGRAESVLLASQAIDGWRRAVEIDGCSAQSVARLAAALGRVGDRAEGLRVIAVHRAFLEADLGIEPDRLVLDVERELRTADARPVALPGTALPVAAPPVASRPEARVAQARPDTKVEAPPSDRPELPAPVVPSASSLSREPRRAFSWRLAAALAVVAAVIGAWRLRAPERPDTGDVGRVAIYSQSLASRDTSLRFLQEAIANGVTNQLSVNAFAVANTGEIRAMESGRITLDSLIAMRRVGTLVELAFESRDEQLRVTVRMLDAATRDQVASNVYDRPTVDALRLEADIVGFVADALKRRLRREVVLRDANEATRDPYVRKLLVTAARSRDDAEGVIRSGYVLDRESAEQLLLSADSLLMRAMAQDPRWAALWVERARVMKGRASLASDARRAKLADSGVTFADRALAIAPDDAQALTIRGMLLASGGQAAVGGAADTMRYARADQDLRRSLAIEPAQAGAWLSLSKVQVLRGQSATAVASARRAVEYDAFLDNGQEAYLVLFGSALTSGKPQDAKGWCARGRESFPDDDQFRLCELTVMRELPRTSGDDRVAWQIVATMDSMAALSPRPSSMAYAKAYRHAVAAAISARAGDANRAREGLSRARALVASDPVLQVDLLFDEAYVHLMLGDRAKAIELLRALIVVRPTTRRILASAPLFRTVAKEVADPPSPTR